MNLRELYQEVIIDHNRHPRQHYKMENPSHQANGYNPLCGDKLVIYLQLNAGVIENISFCGSGCAISQASASLMMDALLGKTVVEAHELFNKFHEMLTGDNASLQSLNKLDALIGVREFPARVKCATLAWHTLEAALDQKNADPVTTE